MACSENELIKWLHRDFDISDASAQLFADRALRWSHDGVYTLEAILSKFSH